MTRPESLRRLALWAAVVVVSGVVLYVPTLTGGSPWSWWIGEAPRIVVFLGGLGLGLFIAHFWWPRTDRWPELERFIAQCLNGPTDGNGGLWISSMNLMRLRALVRPHVLEREGR